MFVCSGNSSFEAVAVSVDGMFELSQQAGEQTTRFVLEAADTDTEKEFIFGDHGGE